MNGSLQNDHPIGFVYDQVDGGIANGPLTGDPTDDTPSTDGRNRWIRQKGATYIGNNDLNIEDRLYAGTQGLIMTCATCHDVHNKINVDDRSNRNYLLLSPNTDSGLCLTCHIK